MIHYYFDGNLKPGSVIQHCSKFTFNYPCESENSCNPIKVVFSKGIYQIECYGAGFEDERIFSINNTYRTFSGYGAYTKGLIHFKEQQTLFLYIGASKGKFNAIYETDPINGGYASCGATDVRLVNGSYSLFDSLKSRIMVAGGSGSIDSSFGQIGHGGTIEGYNATMSYNRHTNDYFDPPRFTPGGTQRNGGECLNDYKCIPGSFGVSRSRQNSGDHGAFGGGGYFSGGSYDEMGSGGGGSSFISGHTGCDAIDIESSDFDSIISTGQSIHYSRLQFYDSVMKSGEETKYIKPGIVIITILNPKYTCGVPPSQIKIPIPPILFFFIITK